MVIGKKVLLAVSLLLLSSCLWADEDHKKDKKENVTIVRELVFYDVDGMNTGDIRTSINKNRLPSKHDAWTEWQIFFGYRYERENEKYKLASFTVEVKTKIILPRLKNIDKKPQPIQVEWKRYTDLLKMHEEGHVDIGIACGNEVHKWVMKKVVLTDTESEMKNQIGKIRRAILRKYQSIEYKYDKDTDHGRTQGARLRKVN